ncbi:MAG TPA: membrane protein insertase YidC [Rubrobacteraceae bacterium]|jgi:YidC/Oxa1 family membrane protein insertase|nr:membrane protein insertase YidC [Rubrobacteraceae bacterium]
MEHIIEFLETLFGPLIDVFGNALEYFHTMGAPWWLSIAILTVIVRSLLFPLTIKQVKSMRAMQDLKPEMDRLRAKYKDNKQRQQEELMKLYQERKVNPLGGCLPLLVQMPIFITMYYVIRGFDQTHPSFASGGILWFKDLTVADPFYILPVLSAVTMLAASEITAKNVDPQQRWLMRLLPVGFTVFLLQFPAGLFMYWITSNLVTLVQNYLIYNHGPGRKVAASSPNEKRAPRNESNALPEPAPKPQNSSSTPGGRAKAKETRRRRRKKRR